MSSRDRFLHTSSLSGALTPPLISPPREIGFQVKLSGTPLRADERGIVMGPPLAVHRGARAVTMDSSRVNPTEYRSACLYWDRISWYVDPMCAWVPPEIGFLHREGFVESGEALPVGEIDGSDFTAGSQEAIFKGLERRDPGAWALNTGSLVTKVPDQLLMPHRGILVRLHNILPVPAADVPLEEVLEFRRRRTAELQALRATLERTYQAIEAAPDKPLAERTELQELDRRARDAIAVSLETKFPFRFTDIEVKVSFGQALKLAGAGAVVGALVLPNLTGVLATIGGLAGAFDVELKAGLRGRRETGPFEYLVRYHKEFNR